MMPWGKIRGVMNSPSPTPAAPLLAARGLAFARGGEPVFGPLDFALEPGQALLVKGGNGAGKTTLLRVLAGLLAAEAGTVEFEGRVVDREHLARGCAFLGHLPGHKADLGALANLDYACGIASRRDGVGAAQALAEVGLAGHE